MYSMSWSDILSVLSIIIAAIALIKSFIDARESCKIILESGDVAHWFYYSGTYNKMISLVPGIRIHIINNGNKQVAIDSCSVVVDKWDLDKELTFNQYESNEEDNHPANNDKILIQPRLRINNQISFIDLANETQYYNNDLCDIMVKIRIKTETCKVFHSKPTKVLKKDLEEALMLQKKIISSL